MPLSQIQPHILERLLFPAPLRAKIAGVMPSDLFSVALHDRIVPHSAQLAVLDIADNDVTKAVGFHCIEKEYE